MCRKRYQVCAMQSLSISVGMRLASSSGTLKGGKDGPYVNLSSLKNKQIKDIRYIMWNKSIPPEHNPQSQCASRSEEQRQHHPDCLEASVSLCIHVPELF